MNKAGSFFLSKNRGFTILEVLVASALTVVCVFAVMEAFNRGLFGMSDVEHYALALSLGQEKMEELKDCAFNAVVSEAKDLVSGFDRMSREVDVLSVHVDLKQIRVTTYWDAPSGESSLHLVTYVANKG